MLSATSESSGVKNSFEYDGSGNLTKTRVDKSGYAKYIEQGSTYTSNGNYLAKSYSDRGYGTTYNYDAYKGTLNSVTDANDKTTSYTYDGNTDRIKTVTSGGSTVTYTYKTNGQLTSLHSLKTRLRKRNSKRLDTLSENQSEMVMSISSYRAGEKRRIN